MQASANGSASNLNLLTILLNTISNQHLQDVFPAGSHDFIEVVKKILNQILWLASNTDEGYQSHRSVMDRLGWDKVPYMTKFMF